MLISFTGTHSTGKTTLLEALKDSPILQSFIFVEEITRVLHRKGFKINREGDDDTQRAIVRSHYQNTNLKDAVLDRCSLDGVVYTHYLYENGNVSEETFREAVYVFERTIKTYEALFWLSPEFEMVADGLRDLDKPFQKRIHELFENYIFQYDINVIKLSGSVENRLKDINKKLEELNV